MLAKSTIEAVAPPGMKAPNHSRREFLQDAIDRAAALQKLGATGETPTQAQVLTSPTSAERKASSRPGKPAERVADRTPARNPERVAASAPVAPRTLKEAPPPQPRTYGAPVSEPPRRSSIALDAPINSPPTTSPTRRTDNFSGRTVEASDSAVGRTTSFPAAGSSNPSGTAEVAMPFAAAPAPAPPAPVDVVPAKIVKRVTPVVSADVSPKAKGYVVVKFEIGQNGRVSNVAVVESTPPGVFDDAATTAVRKWIYEPRKENGVAVTSQSKARLVFDAAN